MSDDLARLRRQEYGRKAVNAKSAEEYEEADDGKARLDIAGESRTNPSDVQKAIKKIGRR